MIYTLPQFPLPLVLFPGEQIPLHIFETRYRKLIAACETEGIHFGILPVVERIRQNTGTEVGLKDILNRYPDGRLDILVRGEHCFKVIDWEADTDPENYLLARVEKIEEIAKPDPELATEISQQMQELFQLMKIPSEQIPAVFDYPAIVHKLAIPIGEEYKLLCIPDPVTRQQYILQRLKKLLPKIREVEEIRKIIEMNGHARLIHPSDN